MRALVVYESMFGNTQVVAQAIAGGLASTMPVEVTEVGAAPASVGPDVALLVVGGPTHAFGLSRPQTREDAARQSSHGVVSQGEGLREWLDALPKPTPAPVAAAFDTHIDKTWVPGSASGAAARRLRKLGLDVAASESFYVTDSSGPLAQGEEDRARRWGEHLASAVAVGTRTT